MLIRRKLTEKWILRYSCIKPLNCTISIVVASVTSIVTGIYGVSTVMVVIETVINLILPAVDYSGAIIEKHLGGGAMWILLRFFLIGGFGFDLLFISHPTIIAVAFTASAAGNLGINLNAIGKGLMRWKLWNVDALLHWRYCGQ